tara:strand:- start:257 stop:871 length:615 start_codon:yes stop_codon:yes gene_type:complete
MKVVIVDYGMGNLFSVHKKLTRLGVNTIVSSKSEEINRADKIILPGVGHFKKALDNLYQLNLIDILNENVIIKKKLTLGICLGMQIMAKHSQEGNCSGLGWFETNVEKIRVSDFLRFKVPHTGWNSLVHISENPLMSNIQINSEFYFVHSYYIKTLNKNEILSGTKYETTFVSGIYRDNIFGVQFHPEKSHDSGDLLFKNFINL